MSEFKPKTFIVDFKSNPTLDKVNALLRPSLLAVAKEYGLDVTSKIRKGELKEIVLQQFVDDGLLEESVLDEFGVGMSNYDLKEIELAKIKANMELQKVKLQYDQELALKRLQAGVPSSKFDVTKHIRMVPPFSENKVDKYFVTFEKIATSLKWPKEFYVILLQSILKGKAQEAYSTLAVHECYCYDTVKKAILKAYELVPEAYRQRFRDFRKSDAQTHAEYAREKETLFQRWCNSRNVDGDYTKLKELVLVEEFKRGIHRDIRTYLNEREVVTLHDAAVKADDYALTHKATLNNNKKNVGITKSNTFGGALSKSEKSTKENVSSDSKADKSTSEKSSFSGICWFCNKVGHARAKCKAWIEAGRPSTKPVGHVALVNESDMVNDMPSSGVELGMQRDNVCDQVRNDYAPFLSVGSVIYEGNVNKQTYNVDILRDTGCSQSLMLQNILPDVTITDSTERVLIKSIEGNYISLPLVQVYLKSDLISGFVKVGLTPSLPMPGITFLLGNDIAGGKVTPQPKMSLTPIIDQDTEKLNDEIPGLFPACIVTRSKSYDMPTVNETLPPSDCTELHENILHCNDESSDDLITRSQLILAQHCDPSLKRFFEKVISSDEIDLVPVGYYLDKDVLMRKYRAPDVPFDEEWRVQYQIVVPAKYCSVKVRSCNSHVWTFRC